MPKFKKGDKVQVYGTYHGELPKREYAYYSSSGTLAKIISIYCPEEYLAKLIGGTWDGAHITVHPKQCRKVRKKAKDV